MPRLGNVLGNTREGGDGFVLKVFRLGGPLGLLAVLGLEGIQLCDGGLGLRGSILTLNKNKENRWKMRK